MSGNTFPCASKNFKTIFRRFRSRSSRDGDKDVLRDALVPDEVSELKDNELLLYTQELILRDDTESVAGGADGALVDVIAGCVVVVGVGVVGAPAK
jgi:hypothetical protein